jgi:glutathione S-transferase
MPPKLRLKLYVVHGSHPCAAVMKALELKGLEYSVVEWPPPLQVPMQRMIFGGRTVPGLQIDGEKVQGSRAIMRRLDELVAEPRLYPTDPAQRARVVDAERWGDEIFQPIGRELIWAAMVHSPDAMVSYSERSKIRLPAPVVRAAAPIIARLESAVSSTNDDVARRDLQALPDQLDKIDAWIEDGTIGDTSHPNAADLQLTSTIRLMMTLADVRPMIEGRPCATLATILLPHADGEMPAGSLRQ